MSLPLLLIVAYILALFIIGIIGRLRSRGTSANFALAGRTLPWPLVSMSIVGLAIGGASTVGVAEQAFRVGLSAGWYNVAWGLGAIITGCWLAARYRALGITTLTELLERYFDKKTVMLGVVCQVLIQVVIISLQYVAGGSILHALLPEYFDMTTGMLTSAVVFIGITYIGGMWSASLSNILNVTLIYVGIAVAVFKQPLGSPAALAAALPASGPWLDPIAGVGVKGILSWITVMVTVNLSLQSIIQIALGAKDGREAKLGFISGGLLMLPIGFLAAWLGLCAKASAPGVAAASALPTAIIALDPVLAGLTLTALWAADISTACSLLLGASTMISRDIYKRYLNPAASDEAVRRIMEWSVIGTGALTFIMALGVSGILNTLMLGLSLTAGFSVILLSALFRPALCTKSAGFYTLSAGLLTLLAWQMVPASRLLPHPIYQEWIICSLVFGLVSWYERKQVPSPLPETP